MIKRYLVVQHNKDSGCSYYVIFATSEKEALDLVKKYSSAEREVDYFTCESYTVIGKP